MYNIIGNKKKMKIKTKQKRKNSFEKVLKHGPSQ